MSGLEKQEKNSAALDPGHVITVGSVKMFAVKLWSVHTSSCRKFKGSVSRHCTERRCLATWAVIQSVYVFAVKLLSVHTSSCRNFTGSVNRNCHE
jgi:hypothetical protein